MATLAIAPSFVIPVQHFRPAVVVQFEAGYMQSYSRFSRTRRTWTVEWRNINETDRDTLIAFFDARVGAEESFTWSTPPRTAAVTVVMDAGEFVEQQISKGSTNVYGIRTQFTEVFDV